MERVTLGVLENVQLMEEGELELSMREEKYIKLKTSLLQGLFFKEQVLPKEYATIEMMT